MVIWFSGLTHISWYENTKHDQILKSSRLCAAARPGGATGRDGHDEGYTMHVEYAFPLYTFHIPIKGSSY